MDSEPVRLWRDKFKLNLSKSWKIDVDKTVTDLVLWRKILNGWKYQTSHGTWKSRAPGIKQLLTEYESREREQLEARNQRDHEASVVSARSGERVSERGNGNVSGVRVQPPSDYFNVGNLVR